jgi:HPt (histidine-containing phosphotransfer) domain-containing protein
MTEQRNSSSQFAMNLPDLLLRVGNDRDLVIELITIFKKKYPPQLLLLQESIASQDVSCVETTSHALIGMLSCLSATRAASLAKHLEQMARDGKTMEMEDVLTSFENEVTNLLTELDDYTTKVEL